MVERSFSFVFALTFPSDAQIFTRFLRCVKIDILFELASIHIQFISDLNTGSISRKLWWLWILLV